MLLNYSNPDILFFFNVGMDKFLIIVEEKDERNS